MPKSKTVPTDLKPLYDQAYKRLKPITLLNTESRREAALLAAKFKAGKRMSGTQLQKLCQLHHLVKRFIRN